MTYPQVLRCTTRARHELYDFAIARVNAEGLKVVVTGTLRTESVAKKTPKQTIWLQYGDPKDAAVVEAVKQALGSRLRKDASLTIVGS